MENTTARTPETSKEQARLYREYQIERRIHAMLDTFMNATNGVHNSHISTVDGPVTIGHMF